MAFKCLLIAAQGLCIASALRSGNWRRYPFLVLLAGLGALGAAVFSVDVAWLTRWYGWVAGPVLLLRLLACLEVSYRQIGDFLYWKRLAAGAAGLGVSYVCLLWRTAESPGGLASFVAWRGYVQVFCGISWGVLTLFWLYAGGWLGWRRDWVSTWYGVLLVVRAAVAVNDLTHGWTGPGWVSSFRLVWTIEAAGWLGLALAFRAFPLSPVLQGVPIGQDSRGAGLGSLPSIRR